MDKETSEIAKLTERLAKDPKSKLFVPLAEEYKKAGDVDGAIRVLTEGLAQNPGYVTARSLLGRLLLTKGKLTGAQQEFEEVIKAHPDNLLAQKKLGDVYVLQNNNPEALKHYKSALALNPADAEIASLVADLEGGRDVRSRLQQPAPEATATPAVQQRKQGNVPSVESKPAAPAAPKPQPMTAVAEKSEAKTAASVPESEEAEDILDVLPLEESPVITPAQPSEADLFAEMPTEHATTAAVEEGAEAEFAPFESAAGEPMTAAEPDAGFALAGAVEELPKEEPLPAPQAPTGESSDDFTTDTLAELYIGQGFYEKAIDIYERMLADNPNSRGLKDKLSRVRAMAEESTKAAPAEAAAASTTPSEALGALGGDIEFESEFPVEPTEKRREAEVTGKGPEEENVFTEAREYKAPHEAVPGAFDEFVPPEPPPVEGKPDVSEFVPREYIPSTAAPRQKTEEPAGAVPRGAATARKATLDRLETWLKNIKKES